MIQVTRQGTEFSSSTEALEGLRAQFERQHYFLLPGLLEPGLLALIQRKIDRGEFRERVHEHIDSNKELCLTANPGVGALLFLIIMILGILANAVAISGCDQQEI